MKTQVPSEQELISELKKRGLTDQQLEGLKQGQAPQLTPEQENWHLRQGNPQVAQVSQATAMPAPEANAAQYPPAQASGNTVPLAQPLSNQDMNNSPSGQFAKLMAQAQGQQQAQPQQAPQSNPNDANNWDLQTILQKLQPTGGQSIANALSVLGGGKPIYDPNMPAEFLKTGGALKMQMAPYEMLLKQKQAENQGAGAGLKSVQTQYAAPEAEANIVAKNAQAGIFPQQQAANGEQTATGLPAAFDSMAQDVANYKVDLKSVLQRVPPAIKAQFVQGVSLINPQYDQKVFQARQDYQNSLSSGTISKNITALNTVIPHIDRLNQSLQALGNGQLPLLNSVKNWWAETTGSGAPARAKTDLVATSNEIESVYRSTGGTEEGIRAWRAGQPATSASPDQQKQWVQEGLGLIEGRLSAMGNDYQQNMGQAAPPNRFMSAPNEAIVNRLGGQNNNQPVPQQQAIGTTATGNKFRKIA